MLKDATKLSYWWLAVKPASLVKIVLPVQVGASMGYAQTRVVDGGLLCSILLFALLVQLAIVLLNDYADREADAVHAELFPQLIDLRVIPQGLIGARQVLMAGCGTALGVVGSGLLLDMLYGRDYGFHLALVSLLVFWLYSFSPAKLNYRGGGELLEMVGVGGVLPLAGFYFYSGILWDYPFLLVLPLLCYALVSALASGLKHEPADRRTGKKTMSVLLSTAAVRRTIFALQWVAAGCTVWAYFQGWYGLFMLFLGALLPLLLALVGCTKQVDYKDLAALGVYKQLLSRAAYSTSLGLVLDFVL